MGTRGKHLTRAERDQVLKLVAAADSKGKFLYTLQWIATRTQLALPTVRRIIRDEASLSFKQRAATV